MRNDLTGDFCKDFIQDLWDEAKERERQQREDALDALDAQGEDDDE